MPGTPASSARSTCRPKKFFGNTRPASIPLRRPRHGSAAPSVIRPTAILTSVLFLYSEPFFVILYLFGDAAKESNPCCWVRSANANLCAMKAPGIFLLLLKIRRFSRKLIYFCLLMNETTPVI